MLAQALDAARQVSMPSDAYGVLCQPSTVLLRPIEQWELDMLRVPGEVGDALRVECGCGQLDYFNQSVACAPGCDR